MWFKQTEPKSPQQPEAPAVRSQPAAVPPAAPAAPAEPAPAAVNVAPAAPAYTANASRITPGLSLKGEISGREDLWIGGSVDGSLRFDTSRVVVGASGVVHGGIEAREIVIEGKVEGDLRAAERLEITQTGRVRGDASAPRLSMQEGAVFNGSIEVVRAGESRSAAPGAGSSSRTSPAPRNQRFQTAQAAGAAAAATAATSPAGSPAGVPAASSDSRESEAAPAGPVAYRGIAADAPERPE
ncbi:MAG TPA: polymer-forming cytoskeletal protein [Candidatus Acidoferrales bacterium]|nr:polymer-forming cytoskeletal protein [Candidatus Acidoferrales bacterium]